MSKTPQTGGVETRAASLRAVDVRRISRSALSWDAVRDGVLPEALPTCVVERTIGQARGAVVSWRWDRDTRTGRSINVGLALKHAHDMGFDHVFIDAVSIDQTQHSDRLLGDVVELARLYTSLPVIAACDEAETTAETWDATLCRPWILSEIRAYCQTACCVTHAGFGHSVTDPRDLSFANEVSVIRSGGYAVTILEILHGRIGMTNIADFAQILAGFSDAVAACHAELSRSDYLLAVFVLTAVHEKRQHIEHEGRQLDYGFRTNLADPTFERIGLERFTLGPFRDDVRSYESARAILLDGNEVAVWRAKMTSSFDRNWIQEVVP